MKKVILLLIVLLLANLIYADFTIPFDDDVYEYLRR